MCAKATIGSPEAQPDMLPLRCTRFSSARYSGIVSTRSRKVIAPCRRRALLQAMTIHRLLKNTAFGPEEIERLVTAYEQALGALGLKNGIAPITGLGAKKAIA